LVQDTFLTVQEIADLLKVNSHTIRSWIDAGTLRAVRTGSRRVRVRELELARFINAGGDMREATKVQEADESVTTARKAFGEVLDVAARLVASELSV
jgi:excisionase family DNA binding protein